MTSRLLGFTVAALIILVSGCASRQPAQNESANAPLPPAEQEESFGFEGPSTSDDMDAYIFGYQVGLFPAYKTWAPEARVAESIGVLHHTFFKVQLDPELKEMIAEYMDSLKDAELEALLAQVNSIYDKSARVLFDNHSRRHGYFLIGMWTSILTISVTDMSESNHLQTLADSGSVFIDILMKNSENQGSDRLIAKQMSIIVDELRHPGPDSRNIILGALEAINNVTPDRAGVSPEHQIDAPQSGDSRHNSPVKPSFPRHRPSNLKQKPLKQLPS